MEYCVSSFSAPITATKPSAVVRDSLPSPVKASPVFHANFHRRSSLSCLSIGGRRHSAVVARASSGGGSSQCEFGSLNTPIEPTTAAGRFLSSVLLNDRKCFSEAVEETLKKLADQRDEAYARRALTAESSEACLHRRIAELKERECQTAVEDVMYLLIFSKFSEIRVHLIPRLSKCLYNGRLEILPSKDWELESIHSLEVLEMIREHLTSVVGWRADFNVTDNWATTEIQRLHLCRIYTASILYGYFLKSATLRHQLEMSLVDPVDDLVLNSGNHLPLPELYKYRQKNVAFGHVHSTGSTSVGQVPFGGKKKRVKLSSYLMGFARDSLVKCAQPNSKEALNLIVRHCCALFGDEKLGLLESDELISTSLASLKRFVLEAVAFGSYLWDAEEYVKTVYNLEEK